MSTKKAMLKIDEFELSTMLFFDIETAPAYKTFDHFIEHDSRLANLYAEKKYMKDENRSQLTLDEHYANNAGLFPEFGAIVCVSIGYFECEGTRENITFHKGRIASFLSGIDEETQRVDSKNMLSVMSLNAKETKKTIPTGWNILGFDMPYISKHMLREKIEIPRIFGILADRGPDSLWVCDLMIYERRGSDFKNTISLDLATAFYGIESSKGLMEGSDVGANWWKKGNHEQIAEYCFEDVRATMRLGLRYAGIEDTFEYEHILVTNEDLKEMEVVSE